MPQQQRLPTFEVVSGEHIGTATVRINDQVMDGMITSVGISVKQGCLPRVWLELDVAVVAHLDWVEVKVLQRTHDMLVALGWKPPPDKEGENDGQ